MGGQDNEFVQSGSLGGDIVGNTGEYFAPDITNEFHTSLTSRELSASSGSSESSSSSQAASSTSATSTVVSQTSAATVSTLSAGGAVAGVATTAVVVITPLFQSLPVVKNLETEITATSVSYALDISYVTTNTLTVQIKSAFDSQSEDYLLTGADDQKTEMSQALKGSFSNLKANTEYTLSFNAFLTGKFSTEITKKSFKTLAYLPDGTLAFKEVATDYEQSKILFTYTKNDASSYLDMTQLTVQAVGKDLTGNAKTVKSAVTGDSSTPTKVDMSGFVQGNYVRLSLWTVSSYPGFTGTDATAAHKYAEMAVYY